MTIEAPSSPMHISLKKSKYLNHWSLLFVYMHSKYIIERTDITWLLYSLSLLANYKVLYTELPRLQYLLNWSFVESLFCEKDVKVSQQLLLKIIITLT